VKQLTKLELAEAYCKVHGHRSSEETVKILSAQAARYPDLEGWILWECHDMSSSRMGMVVIMPYGPSNTFKSLTTLPPLWSPTGMASDMSVAIAYAKRNP
jgi:hypothetical protein